MQRGAILSGDTPHIPNLTRSGAVAPLPPPPDIVDWTTGVEDWPMLDNDVIGDCTVAALLHYAQVAYRWRDGVPFRASSDDAQAGYRQMGWSGTPPGNGCVLSDVMQMWKTIGFQLGGTIDRIFDFALVEIADAKQAMHLAGPLIAAGPIPLSAEDNGDWLTPTNLQGNNAPADGHCFLMVKADNAGWWDVVTWGGRRRAQTGWLDAYCAEIWAPLHPVWIGSGVSPSGVLESAIQDSLF